MAIIYHCTVLNELKLWEENKKKNTINDEREFRGKSKSCNLMTVIWERHHFPMFGQSHELKLFQTKSFCHQFKYLVHFCFQLPLLLLANNPNAMTNDKSSVKLVVSSNLEIGNGLDFELNSPIHFIFVDHFCHFGNNFLRQWRASNMWRIQYNTAVQITNHSTIYWMELKMLFPFENEKKFKWKKCYTENK